eukprot:CAMPEP_0182608124 /NCGR_PEP_ID=MMETSP1330-20130603/2639_1 /TAXON_ID=464278 /ORGANISM="Picochlorum sp., Strain RCC944" /LENGTH=750 /DNA_ID=CAMNT_0024826839 /DNA_START=71 /DNA_END=2319 /DNA_ORIENTATION=-
MSCVSLSLSWKRFHSLQQRQQAGPSRKYRGNVVGGQQANASAGSAGSAGSRVSVVAQLSKSSKSKSSSSSSSFSSSRSSCCSRTAAHSMRLTRSFNRGKRKVLRQKLPLLGQDSASSLVCRSELYGSSKRESCEVVSCDLLVLGSGIAGLTCALEAANYGTEVVVVTKSNIMEGSTKYAQGGVAAVMGQGGGGGRGGREREGKDCVTHHVEDTMNAGCYLNDRKAVEIMCREGPQQVEMLCQIGVPFTTVKRKEGGGGDKKVLHLGKEGGHSHSRVVHAADTTGAAIEKALVEKVLRHPKIRVHENMFALDLLTMPHKGDEEQQKCNGNNIGCYGCDTIDLVEGSYLRFVSKCTVIATGGCGQIYPETTNPQVATGDGIAMASRAGALVKNMEFIQFHPTSLFVDKKSSGDASSVKQTVEENKEEEDQQDVLKNVFLISEAVRGAGAVLRNTRGEAFMSQYDARADLAPRDIVARAIYDQMRLHETSHVFLDATHLSEEEVNEEFPHISSHVSKVLGIEMSESWIPVVPAQHYVCGGVLTNTSGETNVKGLYAIGEAACTGVHGANRLASNSLLEGLVFGKRSVLKSLAYMDNVHPLDLLAAEHSQLSLLRFNGDDDDIDGMTIVGVAGDVDGDDGQQVTEYMKSIQNLMWKYAGILRNDKGLKKGLKKVRQLRSELQEQVEKSESCKCVKHAELMNMVDVAELVLIGARKREASAGLHFNVDRPERNASDAEDANAAALNLSTEKKKEL